MIKIHNKEKQNGEEQTTMKRFSEFFSEYVAKTRLTWTEAANRCGVERTLLSRYASGKKTPDSLDKVLKIAQGLGMSEQQTEEFQLLWQISKTGEYRYCALRLIGQIFEGHVIDLDTGWAGEALDWNGKGREACHLHGQEEIRGALRHFIEEASRLRIHMNFGGLLSGIHFGCRTEQIIEMDHMGSREEEVEEIKWMVPHLYFGQDYTIYCHYRRCEETAGLNGRISMLLSDKVLMLFSEDLERGIYTYEAGYRDYYGQIFAEDLKKCHRFGGSGCISGKNTELPGEAALLENEATGISFWYEKLPYERIWVWKRGDEKNGFYVEEAQLVKMFLIFMGIQQEEGESSPEDESESYMECCAADHCRKAVGIWKKKEQE